MDSTWATGTHLLGRGGHRGSAPPGSIIFDVSMEHLMANAEYTKSGDTTCASGRRRAHTQARCRRRQQPESRCP
eukprot:671863-Rhodomonas_salina.2